MFGKKIASGLNRGARGAGRRMAGPAGAALIGGAAIAGAGSTVFAQDGPASQVAYNLTGDRDAFRYTAKAYISNGINDQPMRDRQGPIGGYYGRGYSGDGQGLFNYRSGGSGSFRPNGSAVFGLNNMRRG